MNIPQIGFPQSQPQALKMPLSLPRPSSFDASFQKAETFRADTLAKRQASRANETNQPDRKIESKSEPLKEKTVTRSASPTSGRKVEREDHGDDESDRTAISRAEDARPEPAGADKTSAEDAARQDVSHDKENVGRENKTDAAGAGEKTAATDEQEAPSSKNDDAAATKKNNVTEATATASLKKTASESGPNSGSAANEQLQQTSVRNPNTITDPSAVQAARPQENLAQQQGPSPAHPAQAKNPTTTSGEAPVQTTAAQNPQNTAEPQAAATIAPPWQPPTGKGEIPDPPQQQGEKGTYAVLETMLAQKNSAASSQGDTAGDLFGNGHGAGRQSAAAQNNASSTTAAFTLPEQPPPHSPPAALSQPGALARPGAALPVQDAHIANQVIEHLATNPLKGNSSIRMRLEPAELGQLKMELQVSKNQVTLHLLADNRQVQEALLHQIDRLRDTLAQQGLTLGDVSVSTRESQNNDTGAGHRSKRNAHAGVSEAPMTLDEELPYELFPGSTYELGRVSLRI